LFHCQQTVIVDHAVYNGIRPIWVIQVSQLWGISEIFLDATKNTNSTYLPLDTVFNVNNKLNQNCVFGYKRQNDNVGNLISKMTT
jgi:hypothetical protein